MKAKFSALFDGEVDPREAAALLSALRDHGEARQSFHIYEMVGEALRDDPPAVADIAERVMASIQQEPDLAAMHRSHHGWRRPLLAVAASLAGVAVVSAVALLPQEREAVPVVLAQKVLPTVVDSGLAANDLQEFLIAHQTHSAASYFGGSQHQVRTVSLVEQGRPR